MKFLGFVFVFLITTQSYADATQSFSSLMSKYRTSPQPTQEQLQRTTWKYIGITNNSHLKINEGFRDKYNEDGLKNWDGSQLIWSFDSYDHPLFKLTVSRFNAYSEGRDTLLTRIHFVDESAAFAFSAYASGKTHDIYYVQNCRIYRGDYLICPVTLKILDEAMDKYKNLPIARARDRITIVQFFKRN